jgi:hypothetical protein
VEAGERQLSRNPLGSPPCFSLQARVDLVTVEPVVCQGGPELRPGQPAVVLPQQVEILGRGLPGGNDLPDVEAGPCHDRPPPSRSVAKDHPEARRIRRASSRSSVASADHVVALSIDSRPISRSNSSGIFKSLTQVVIGKPPSLRARQESGSSMSRPDDPVKA